MGLRASWFAQQMVDEEVLLQLATLLKPGTDAGEQLMPVLLHAVFDGWGCEQVVLLSSG
jgi:hypothetical protein